MDVMNYFFFFFFHGFPLTMKCERDERTGVGGSPKLSITEEEVIEKRKKMRASILYLFTGKYRGAWVIIKNV